MARLPRSGASFSSLYEYETTLEEVVSRLGFSVLSGKDAAYVREKIGSAIGQWLRTEGDYLELEAKLDVEDVQRSLLGIAKHLDQVDKILAAVGPGIHHGHSIEVVGLLTSALCDNPEVGSIEAAQKFLADFRSRAETVSHGAKVAAWLLGVLPKQKRGRVQQDWHDEFTRAVIHVCDLNDIPPRINTDRVTREHKGRFFEAATAFEQLLPPRMRAPGADALVQRLVRSKKRVGAER